MRVAKLKGQIMGDNRKPDWRAGLVLDSRPYLTQVWLLTNPIWAKVEIISQRGLSSLSAITVRTLRPICPDCMSFVWQYCRLYLLDKESLVLLCSWNHLSSSTINHYMELEKEIIIITNKIKPFYMVYLLPGEIYWLKQQGPLLGAIHNTFFIISLYPKSRSTLTRQQSFKLVRFVSLYIQYM